MTTQRPSECLRDCDNSGVVSHVSSTIVSGMRTDASSLSFLQGLKCPLRLTSGKRKPKDVDRAIRMSDTDVEREASRY